MSGSANHNFLEVPDVALAAALTALSCPLYSDYAGGTIWKDNKVRKKFFFQPQERTRRLMKLWESENPMQDEGVMSEDQEKLVLRFMRQFSYNRFELLRCVNKSTDLAVIKRADGFHLMPCRLKEKEKPDEE